MYRNRKRFRLGNFLAVALSCILLIGATGFSYNVHYCHGSIASIAVYPELIRSKAGCGCESANITNKEVNANTSSPVSLGKQNCCKNFNYYQKYSPNAERDFHFLQKPIAGIISKDLNHEILTLSKAKSEYKISLLKIHPPPISGKALVFFLNQIRIPSFSGDCLQA